MSELNEKQKQELKQYSKLIAEVKKNKVKVIEPEIGFFAKKKTEEPKTKYALNSLE